MKNHRDSCCKKLTNTLLQANKKCSELAGGRSSELMVARMTEVISRILAHHLAASEVTKKKEKVRQVEEKEDEEEEDKKELETEEEKEKASLVEAVVKAAQRGWEAGDCEEAFPCSDL